MLSAALATSRPVRVVRVVRGQFFCGAAARATSARWSSTDHRRARSWQGRGPNP